MEGLEVNLEDVSMDYDLRLDPKYYDFSVKNRFKLLNMSKYPLVKLRDLIKPDYIVFKYENDAIYKGLPTSAEYFDEDGEILKKINAEKEESAIFNLEYLENIIKACPIGNTVNIALKTNEPLKVTYNIGDATLTYYLAPYMEE